jgi:hypothetical protein
LLCYEVRTDVLLWLYHEPPGAKLCLDHLRLSTGP